MSDLKDCPLCGSEAQLFSYESCDCCGKSYNAGVECKNGDCHAVVDHHDTDEQAVAAWSSRSPNLEGVGGRG